jgi:ABC-type dipeptide/oligopeptide/nickel transport system ATPase component
MRLTANDIEIKIPDISKLKKCDEDTIIGQSRVKDAMLSGLKINKDGYNIFVVGQTGSGRRTIIQNLSKTIASKRDVPKDWAYANNFKEPTKPIAIDFLPGQAKKFSTDLEETLRGIFKEFPNLLSSPEIDDAKKSLNSNYKKKREEFFEQISNYAKKLGFVVQSTPTGLSTIPAIGDRPMSIEELNSLSEDTKRNLQVEAEKISELLKNEKIMNSKLNTQYKWISEHDWSILSSRLSRIIKGNEK